MESQKLLFELEKNTSFPNIEAKSSKAIHNSILMNKKQKFIDSLNDILMLFDLDPISSPEESTETMLPQLPQLNELDDEM